LDDWVIKPGDDIYLAIERGLEASRTLVLCLSPTALANANKFAFLNFLKRNGPRILPPPEVSQYWHICRVVLFGRDNQFDEKLPKASATRSRYATSGPC